MKRLIDEGEIRSGVAELGRRIAADYRDRPLTILGVLTGSIILLSDLIRKIDLPLRVGLIQAASYRGRSTTPSELTINAEILPDIARRDVLLVDDAVKGEFQAVELFVNVRGGDRVRVAS